MGRLASGIPQVPIRSGVKPMMSSSPEPILASLNSPQPVMLLKCGPDPRSRWYIFTGLIFFYFSRNINDYVPSCNLRVHLKWHQKIGDSFSLSWDKKCTFGTPIHSYRANFIHTFFPFVKCSVSTKNNIETAMPKLRLDGFILTRLTELIIIPKFTEYKKPIQFDLTPCI